MARKLEMIVERRSTTIPHLLWRFQARRDPDTSAFLGSSARPVHAMAPDSAQLRKPLMNRRTRRPALVESWLFRCVSIRSVRPRDRRVGVNTSQKKWAVPAIRSDRVRQPPSAQALSGALRNWRALAPRPVYSTRARISRRSASSKPSGADILVPTLPHRKRLAFSALQCGISGVQLPWVVRPRSPNITAAEARAGPPVRHYASPIMPKIPSTVSKRSAISTGDAVKVAPDTRAPLTSTAINVRRWGDQDRNTRPTLPDSRASLATRSSRRRGRIQFSTNGRTDFNGYTREERQAISWFDNTSSSTTDSAVGLLGLRGGRTLGCCFEPIPPLPKLEYGSSSDCCSPASASRVHRGGTRFRADFPPTNVREFVAQRILWSPPI